MTLKRLTSAGIMFSLAVIAAGGCGGCDASGYPAFVKISPDGRFIIYQDGSHSKTYVYAVVRSHKTVFDGYTACMNADISMFVLRSNPLDQRMRCHLVHLGPDGPRPEQLPDLPMAGFREARMMFVGQGSDVVALLYDSSWAERPSHAKILEYQSSQWEAVSVPAEWRDQDLWVAHEPLGDRLTGYVFSPRDKSFDLPEDQEPGLNVEMASTGTPDFHMYYVLRSPDGDYTVTIRDPEDIWNRVWLTEATGKRVILLDKNDLPARVTGAIVGFPAGLVLSIFRPKI